jgi:predicted TIM-barrel fold metal-dependent hydrolase
MALKNRTGTAEYEYDGDTIKLAATFAALEQLADATGMDALLYIQSVSTPRELAEMFYHLQSGTSHTREEIYNAFFAEVAAFADEEVQKKLAECIAILLGSKRASMLKEGDSQKK